jgi:hypothetical protein
VPLVVALRPYVSLAVVCWIRATGSDALLDFCRRVPQVRAGYTRGGHASRAGTVGRRVIFFKTVPVASTRARVYDYGIFLLFLFYKYIFYFTMS